MVWASYSAECSEVVSINQCFFHQIHIKIYVHISEHNEYIVYRMEESSLISKDDEIIEVGCGNGAMLVALSEEGFTVRRITSIDTHYQSHNSFIPLKCMTESKWIRLQ